MKLPVFENRRTADDRSLFGTVIDRETDLLVDGIEFDEDWVGRKLRIGAVELVLTRETTPCSMMDAQHQGLTAALAKHWRGGICCNVVNPGHIKLGDQIEFD